MNPTYKIKYNNYELDYLDKEICIDYIKRKFKLLNITTNKSKFVIQYQYQDWSCYCVFHLEFSYKNNLKDIALNWSRKGPYFVWMKAYTV